MASPRRRSSTSGSTEPVLRVARSLFDTELAKQLGIGQDLLERPISDQADIRQLKSDFYTWDEYNEQLLASRFTNGKIADEYRMVSFAGSFRDPQQELYWAQRNISSQMRKLESVRQRLHLFDSKVEDSDMSSSSAEAPIGRRVFIVHGHNGDVKLQVAQFLERITSERPVILHEQADSGRTVIEKFEDHASEAGFAVVLLTADDVGGVKGSTEQNPRARQNVVLEFGFFIGKLGRGRVVALYEDGVELPSDLSGVLYKPLAGNWHTELVKELMAAKIDIDLTKLV